MKPAAGSQRHGFTLCELLCVVVILLAVAGLRSHSENHAMGRAKAAMCLQNHQLLINAWQTYAADHKDKFTDNRIFSPNRDPQWISGWLDWTAAKDNTNAALLTNSKSATLAPYLKLSAAPFKCPSDRYLSAQQSLRGWRARVRSVSMNCAVGVARPEAPPDLRWGYQYFSDLTDIRPADLFVTLDEHPDSINDPQFYLPDKRANQWFDLPASFHSRAGTFSFCDGHVELKRWTIPSTVRPVLFNSDFMNVSTNSDRNWIRAHGTGH